MTADRIAELKAMVDHAYSVLGTEGFDDEAERLREALPALIGEVEALTVALRYACSQRDAAEAELARVKNWLTAYQRTVNEIDDRSEYRAFGKEDIRAILDNLRAALAPQTEGEK